MKETTNLKLKLYDTADAPNLVAGYNASMEAIDKASAEWAQLKAALAAIETLKTQIGELQTQIAAKADTSTVTALTTRVSTAEGEIDTLQTTVNAATAAGTTQLTVADLTAAKTNTKNIVTA